nr:Uncharacterized protein conserved in bacteria [Klebsiella pneumoniae]
MSKLNIRAVRSYRSDKSVILDLSKRINLVYGQNGSGKSTISGYFYKSDDEAYKIALLNVMMNISLLSTIVSLWRIHFIINLNSRYFTLSQENKEVMEAIELNNGKIASLKKKLSSISSELEKKKK